MQLLLCKLYKYRLALPLLHRLTLSLVSLPRWFCKSQACYPSADRREGTKYLIPLINGSCMFGICTTPCNAALSPVKMFWQTATLLPTVNYLLPCSPIHLNKLILVLWTIIFCLLFLFLLCFLACFEQEKYLDRANSLNTPLLTLFSLTLCMLQHMCWVKICSCI